MIVYCPCADCKHNNEMQCEAVEITLSSHSVMTVWEGRQDFWKCKAFEQSDEAKAMIEELKKFL